MKAKRFSLDLSEYTVKAQRRKTEDDGKGNMVTKIVIEDEVYPLRENISVWLRTAGIFRTAEDIVEAVTLAKAIRDCKENVHYLDEREVQILKQTVNKLVDMTADGKAGLGGVLHEEAIVRAITLEEIEIDV
jgi:hypothetical protein